MSDIEIRTAAATDRPALETLYRAAFPDEDLLPLLAELLETTPEARSLVAAADDRLVGHICFTTCGVAGQAAAVALLGPLAVAPAWQRRGIGGALLRRGLREQERAGVGRVLVLGDPAFYGRFGFRAESGVAPPYALPPEWRDAWQSLPLVDDGPELRGGLEPPAAWRDPGLWLP